MRSSVGRRGELLLSWRIQQKWVFVLLLLLLECVIPLLFVDHHARGAVMGAVASRTASNNTLRGWYSRVVGSTPAPAQSQKAALNGSAPPTASITFSGWAPTAVQLENTGILPSAVTMGRYLLIIGGGKAVGSRLTEFQSIEQYASSTINVLDLTRNVLVMPLMLVHNGSRVSNKAGLQPRDEPPPPPPLPPRVPAELHFPAVGTANTVRLGSAAYIVGFCTTLLDGVSISPSDAFKTFLRSLQVIRLYQEEFPPAEDVTMDIQNTSVPETAILRYNAGCVGNGNDTIYIFGGVSLENGQELASVSQYNVVTGQFIDAGWKLDSAPINPGVLENSELAFIATRVQSSAGGELYFKSMVSVVDLMSVKVDIGPYETSSLDWFSPQLIMYNHTLAVMGATYGRSFDRQEVWPDIMKALGVVQEVPIRFSPLRTNAVVVGVPNVDGVTVYLAGGQIPPPDGLGISSDVFMGTMHVDDDHVSVRVEGFHYISIADEMSHDDDDGLNPMSLVVRKEIQSPVGSCARLVASASFSSMDSTEDHQSSTTDAPNMTVDITQTITPTADIPTPTPTPPPVDPPNNDGNVTVLVNGYEPLWYNFTFSILLSENTAQACPGINDEKKSMTGRESVGVSPCLLRLSDSPTCNSPLFDMGNLTSENAQPYSMKVTDPNTNISSIKHFIAVGPLTLTGSLTHGILNLTGRKPHYDEGMNNAFKFHRRHTQPVFGNDTTTAFYEQLFLYVCFSSGAFNLPQCKSHETHLPLNGGKAPKPMCTTAFYKPLNGDRPFVLSPVTSWVPDTTTTTTTTTPAPSSLPNGRVSLNTFFVLLTSAISIVVFACFLLFFLARGPSFGDPANVEQQLLLQPSEDGGDEEDLGCGVGRGAALSADQKKGLLDGKYRVLHRLGRGSFSVVYLVERVTDGERFALKYVQCTDNVDRLEAMRECEVAYALQGHPNVIRLIDMFMSYRFDTNLHANSSSSSAGGAGAGAGGGRGRGQQQRNDHSWLSPDASVIVRVESDTVTNGAATPPTTIHGERYLSLVMAYHERGDLGKWIRQQRSEPMIPEVTIVSIAFQILTVLQFMHRQNPPIIHRDLKPENILLDSAAPRKYPRNAGRQGSAAAAAAAAAGGGGREPLRIVVTDFGLSRVMDKTFCETGVGSLPYVAPECWQRRYSTKVDIWAAGCILYAACAKRVDSDNVKVMFSECNRPDFRKKLLDELTQVYGYSMALAAFIVYLLEPDPVRRPNAEDALQLIRRRRKDVVGTCDELMMVSMYKDDKNTGDAAVHCQSQNIDKNEKKGVSVALSTENRQQCNAGGGSSSSDGITGGRTAAAEGLVARENIVHHHSASDASVQPIGSRSTLPTGSFGHYSPAESWRSQPNQSRGTSDGVLREQRLQGDAPLSSKRQLELCSLEKYFETIADENEQCEFLIAQQPPLLLSAPQQTGFRPPSTLATALDAATTLSTHRDCGTVSPPLARRVDGNSTSRISWDSRVNSEKKYCLSAAAAAEGGEAVVDLHCMDVLSAMPADGECSAGNDIEGGTALLPPSCAR